MAETIKRHNLTACPVCGARMELMSQQGGFVSAGCTPCYFSMTVPIELWATAKAERDAANVAASPASPSAPSASE